MTDLERVWFEAGRRARQELGLVAPPSFYALLAAAVRRATNENGTSATEPRSRHTTDHPSSKEKVNDNSTSAH